MFPSTIHTESSEHFARNQPDTCIIQLMEREDCYMINAELPAMNKDEIYVHINGNSVILGTKRRFCTSARIADNLISTRNSMMDDDFHLIHKFQFDLAVDMAKAHATYKNDKLELVLPKSVNFGKRLLIN